MVTIIEKLLKERPRAYDRVIGNVGKELVRTLLEECGYSVYPFGYENYCTHIKDLVCKGKLRRMPQLQRMPDLLVVDEEAEDIKLVEVIVRTRKTAKYADIGKQKLEGLRQYWPDSILAVVLPKSEYVFYAENVNKLKITDPEFVNFDISDSPINKVFPKIDDYPEVLKELQELSRKFFAEI